MGLFSCTDVFNHWISMCCYCFHLLSVLLSFLCQLSIAVLQITVNQIIFMDSVIIFLSLPMILLMINVIPIYANPYKHSTCVPRWNNVETTISTSFQRGITWCVCRNVAINFSKFWLSFRLKICFGAALVNFKIFEMIWC